MLSWLSLARGATRSPYGPQAPHGQQWFLHLDVEGNNNKYLQEDLKAFIQDYKGKPQHNKACRWILGRCGTGRKKSWKRQRQWLEQMAKWT